MRERADKLTQDLERASLHQVRRWFSELNASLFADCLRTPTFSLSDSKQKLGEWCAEHRELRLSRTLLIDHGWGVLVEVLKHEMAHQYVDEVLGGGDSPHGQAFQAVCRERGIDAGALGVPTGLDDGDAPVRVLERVAKLLALAESPNVHEAENAMSAAQRLMLKYNIDAALSPNQKRYSFRQLGKPTGRVQESERNLSIILDEHFFVEAIWVPVWRPLENKRGSVLEICGSLENLELAEYAYEYLTRTAERLWKEHKVQCGIRRDANRRAFLSGVMSGFAAKLSREKKKNEKEGLVWRGDGELSGYFRRRHPYIRTTRQGGRHDRDSYRAGHEAGGRIVLNRGVARGPSAPPRLLRGRRQG
jgi:hypothetical protein